MRRATNAAQRRSASYAGGDASDDVLENAEDDRSDEKDRCIRCHNAQRSDDGHGKLPWLNAGGHWSAVGKCNAKASKTFPVQKVSLAVAPADDGASS
jgi:hypothetical protein